MSVAAFSDQTWIIAFARQAAIRDAGLYEAFEAAEQSKDFDACNRIATQVGYPYSPPLGPSDRRGGGFVFASVGSQLDAGLKPIQWLVRGYVEADSLALMFGDPGCGKSFAAIDLACCIATGTPWHGNKTTPGAVFYIAGEGQNGLMRRFAAWSQHNAVPLAGAPLFVSHRAAQLINAGAAAEVANAVEEMQADAGEAPALIVVDTLARLRRRRKRGGGHGRLHRESGRLPAQARGMGCDRAGGASLRQGRQVHGARQFRAEGRC